MAEDIDGEMIKGRLARLRFARRDRTGKGDRKRSMKVQLCHAMNQITIDVNEVIEVHRREMLTVGPDSE